jgi:hypothetical protein
MSTILAHEEEEDDQVVIIMDSQVLTQSERLAGTHEIVSCSQKRKSQEEEQEEVNEEENQREEEEKEEEGNDDEDDDDDENAEDVICEDSSDSDSYMHKRNDRIKLTDVTEPLLYHLRESERSGVDSGIVKKKARRMVMRRVKTIINQPKMTVRDLQSVRKALEIVADYLIEQ